MLDVERKKCHKVWCLFRWCWFQWSRLSGVNQRDIFCSHWI